jgi:tRNA-splicing ligase RtcB
MGEGAWTTIIDAIDDGEAEVFDLVTGDPAESFLAEGVVVHNCGNKAVQTELRVGDVRERIPQLMDEIVQRISFGIGRTNAQRVDHPVLDAIDNAEFEPQRRLAKLARDQLGTVGSGNHYVDLFADEDDRVWVGVHFGSRGFGHRTASGFLALAQGLAFDAKAREGEMDSPPVLFALGTELADAYLSAMKLAGEYAYAGRDLVVDRVLEILGRPQVLQSVHVHHNFAWREEHGGREYMVIRKGATPLVPGERSFIGGSMADMSVIVEGVAGDELDEAVGSTVHGAGRVMSRRQAAGRVRRRKVKGRVVAEVVKPGLVDFDAVKARLREQGVELRGAGADEAPEVYKRLDEVLGHHGASTRIVHRLRPLGVAMAGLDVYDPYKD